MHPVTTQQQTHSIVKIKNDLEAYPKIDLFANFKIKRTTIFIKYEHLSQYFGNNNYFLNSYYAMDPATLKYGLRWVFND